jgi:hypothetical protein
VSTLVTSSTHSGSAPERLVAQVSLSTGVHMSQFAPTDTRPTSLGYGVRIILTMPTKWAT